MSQTGHETPHDLQTLSREDVGRAVAVLTLAFANDPGVRWMFRDGQAFLRSFPVFVEAFAGQAFDSQTAFADPTGLGVALWLPPGTGPDEQRLEHLIKEAVPADDQPHVMNGFEQLSRSHPAEPHWHLPLIGDDPTQQGKGIGTRMIRAVLSRLDRENVPAYLEATSPRNVPLYERLGFRAVGTVRVGSSPPIVPMIRQPNPGH